jgi:uncharacterized protein YbaP (TraB family)
MTTRLGRLRWLVVLTFVLSVACDDEKVTPDPTPQTSSTAAPSSAPSPRASEVASAAPAPSTSEPEAEAQPFMWAAVTKGGTSYLLGTVHLGQPAEKLPKVVFEKLDAAKTFISEADTSNADAQAMMARAMLPPDKSLEEMLGPEDWKKLVAQVGATMPPQALSKFKPWFASIAITQSMVPPGPPMDQVLQDRARKANKKMVFLEELDEQLDLFEKVVTLDMLKMVINEIPKQKSLMTKVQKAYPSGDADAVASALFEPAEMKKFPKMYELFFHERNRTWLPELKKQLAAGDAFVAVGAGHLLGDESVIALLAKEGIEVERVGSD